MELAQTVSSFSCCAKCRQSALLKLRHDRLSCHLVDLLFFLAYHAIILNLSSSYNQSAQNVSNNGEILHFLDKKFESLSKGQLSRIEPVLTLVTVGLKLVPMMLLLIASFRKTVWCPHCVLTGPHADACGSLMVQAASNSALCHSLSLDAFIKWLVPHQCLRL